jgi:Xaa-Pro aminopeptidase
MGMVKTRKEVALLKKSARITDSCIKVIKDSLREDITEEELRRRINAKIRSQGAGLSFQTLVACGKRSAIIHPKPHATNNIISGIGYADFGASYKGYKTDITVPFIKGYIGKKEKKIVATTLRSYKLASSSIRIGDLCWKLFKKIYDFEKANGFELKHGLGHGVGKKIHEYPFIVMPKKEKLKRKKTERKKRNWKTIMKTAFNESMVFTIEPGVYVDNVGGCRLENDFLMTKNGPKALTHSRLIKV